MTADIHTWSPLASIVRPTELAEFCRRWQVQALDLYGSAVTGELRSDSDLDFLVTFRPHSEWSLLDHVRMKQELEALTGREVDLMTRRALERNLEALSEPPLLDAIGRVH